MNFHELKCELRRRGYYRKPTGRILAELSVHAGLFFVGLGIVIGSSHLAWQAVGMLINVAGATGISTNTHTTAHFATSEKRWLNILLIYVGYPLFGQFTITYWWKKHNFGHHRVPNVVDRDNDVDFMPLFAYSERDLKGVGYLGELYYRYQGLLMPFGLLLNGLNIQTYDWHHLWSTLRDPQRRTWLHYLDVTGLLGHWMLWLVVPAMFFPLVDVILFNVVHRALFGIAIFIFFAPAHYPAEAIAIDERQLGEDPLLLQTATVVNFRTGPIGALFCGGVQYQIEHHLFPSIAHVFYPEMSKLVREFCEEHGYPYRTLGWGEALWKSYLMLWHPKKVEARLEDFRLAPQPSELRSLQDMRETGVAV